MTTECTENAGVPICVSERDSNEPVKTGAEAKELIDELLKYNPIELINMLENTQVLKQFAQMEESG
jgi:hypothetical protein